MASPAIVIPEDVTKQSGCVSIWPTRIHPHYDLVNDVTTKLTKEYNAEMEVNLDTHTISTLPKLGPTHVTALIIPYCLDDRLALMTRFCELTFLNDDHYDDAGAERKQAYNDQLQSFFGNSSEDANPSIAAWTQQIQARFLVEMLEVDRVSTMNLMETYSRILQAASMPKNAGIASLADYLPFRVRNSGLEVFQDMCCFAMGLKLTDTEKKKLESIVNAAHHSTLLINDFWSWPKEVNKYLEEAATGPAKLPMNAVCITMQEHGCSEAEAQQRVLDEVVNQQKTHLRRIRELEEKEGPVCERFRLYFKSVQYMASGLEYWSAFSPRYPKKHDLNQGECYIESGQLRCRLSPNTQSKGKTTANGHPSSGRANGGGLQNGSSTYPNGNVHYTSIPTAALGDTHFASITENGSGPKKTNGGALENGLANGSVSKTLQEPQGQLKCEFVQAPDDTVLAPYKYLASLPSKNIRDKFIDALNIWLRVPRSALNSIKRIVTLLHHASLMVDDIEDNSILRRGKPSTHVLYGEAQTINSANHAFVSAFAEVQQLTSPSAAAIFIKEVQNMHCGQALDLSWKHETHCPTVDEYMMMIDNKTGAMFRLCVQLMQAESSVPSKHIDPTPFVTQLGRYFQVRDDHQNLVSSEYADSKGFCEDLDEGKVSLPLIYTLLNPTSEVSVIKGILQHRSKEGLPLHVKKYILAQMQAAGALDATLTLAREMQTSLMNELHRLEGLFGSRNSIVELILRRLWV
ncbi:bifunctional terpene synthase/polyprenyl synthetase family protein [Aspergillus undulatus]|uniref:bifunctional terpene synthase/polyprenyl synthetase family protein n=1 Tax=Aspergillus undulatus TaxID=1810928 RepID=UPI003CCE19F0